MFVFQRVLSSTEWTLLVLLCNTNKRVLQETDVRCWLLL